MDTKIIFNNTFDKQKLDKLINLFDISTEDEQENSECETGETVIENRTSDTVAVDVTRVIRLSDDVKVVELNSSPIELSNSDSATEEDEKSIEDKSNSKNNQENTYKNKIIIKNNKLKSKRKKNRIVKNTETLSSSTSEEEIFNNDNGDSDASDKIPKPHTKLPKYKYKCLECNVRRENKKLLTQHMQVHDGFAENECKTCRKIFSTPVEVIEHYDSFRKYKNDEHYKVNRPYPCNQCNVRFMHQKHIAEHLRIHTGEKNHLCTICGKGFLRRHGLKTHLEVHNVNSILNGTNEVSSHDKIDESDMKTKSFMCDLCGNDFKHATQLKIHMNRHAQIKEFQCKFCEKAFVTDTDRQRHTRIHTGEKPHACKFCEKKFADFGSRVKHERTHTGEKPYDCSTCGKKFSNSNGLRVHQRAVHNGLKRYNCHQCTLGFTKKLYLQNHMKNHISTEEEALLLLALCKPVATSDAKGALKRVSQQTKT